MGFVNPISDCIQSVCLVWIHGRVFFPLLSNVVLVNIQICGVVTHNQDWSCLQTLVKLKFD